MRRGPTGTGRPERCHFQPATTAQVGGLHMKTRLLVLVTTKRITPIIRKETREGMLNAGPFAHNTFDIKSTN